MKPTKPLIALLAAALTAGTIAPAFVRADEHDEPEKSAASPAADEDAGETFEHGMEHANKAYQALKKSAFDNASRDTDLRQAQALEQALLASKGVADEIPMMGPAKQKYGDDTAAYRRDLRAGLIEAQQAALKLETAVNAGDTAAAKAAFEEVSQSQKDGHRAFRPGRDNVGRPDAKGH